MPIVHYPTSRRAARATRVNTVSTESDTELVDRLARGAFGYFETCVNPVNGLVADNSRPGSPCSIAVVGFALSCYPLAVERG